MDLSKHHIVVTGGAGFLGRVVCDRLTERGCKDVLVPRRSDFDLTREDDVRRLYGEVKPDVVIHLAAEVGGIGANADDPGRFFYANMAMGLHLIEHARRVGLRKFIQVGTICSYPGQCDIPMREVDLWTDYPEPTNAPYGIAKKSLLVMLDAYHRQYGLCSAYIMPTNLYGPGDNTDAHRSHVIPALIGKCLHAIEHDEDHILVWGSGRASRDFLYVEDAAEGVVRAAERIDEPDPINLGTGRATTIAELIDRIVELTGFTGAIHWDGERPEGQLQRCVCIDRARQRLDWKPHTELSEGLMLTIRSMRTDPAVAPGR